MSLQSGISTESISADNKKEEIIPLDDGELKKF